MSGVYGSFLDAFPEQKVEIRFIDGPVIFAILNHSPVSTLKRTTIGGTVLEEKTKSRIYIEDADSSLIREGDRFIHPDYGNEWRVVGRTPFQRIAGYEILTIERVGGKPSLNTEDLEVKSAVFD